MPYYTYIATNKAGTVIYTGMTKDLKRREREHTGKYLNSFTAKYNVNKIIWHKEFESSKEALKAEKRIKGWTRDKKLALIQGRVSSLHSE